MNQDIEQLSTPRKEGKERKQRKARQGRFS